MILFISLLLIKFSFGLDLSMTLHPELHPIHSLYHSQNYRGHYNYGFATPMITRNEIRTDDGMTQGSYSYMDTNGILQTVKYTADPIHGFQVSATNLPKDLPEVAEAKAKHLALFSQNSIPQPVQDLPEVIAARQAHLAAMEAAKNGVMPTPVQDTPEVAKAKAEHFAIFNAIKNRDESLRASINSNSIEYQPLNDKGLNTYGYVGGDRNPDAISNGGYSFIDVNGNLKTVRYSSGTDGSRNIGASVNLGNGENSVQLGAQSLGNSVNLGNSGTQNLVGNLGAYSFESVIGNLNVPSSGNVVHLGNLGNGGDQNLGRTVGNSVQSSNTVNLGNIGTLVGPGNLGGYSFESIIGNSLGNVPSLGNSGNGGDQVLGSTVENSVQSSTSVNLGDQNPVSTGNSVITSNRGGFLINVENSKSHDTEF